MKLIFFFNRPKRTLTHIRVQRDNFSSPGSLTVTAAASIYGPDNNSSDLSNMSKMHKQVPRLQQTDDDLVKNAQAGHKI